ncbi:CHAP domain-containing protein [Amycolatopsis sp. NPDC051716]|uniref:CHAP domain-containing protein n=1 Tax=Amycolatopsis sp. NPDC051716 TaxID=3155804 RepID=UPI00342526B5
MRRALRFCGILLTLSAALVATPANAAQAPAANLYPPGECTWWASARRAEVGRPIPQVWGNAKTWDDFARRDGYAVDQTPAAGAIMQSDAGSLGHVAFVETVDADGRWQVSEMNWVAWNIVSHRTFTAAQAASYDFIH